MEDEGKKIKEKFENNKKRIRDEKEKKEWVGGALLGANSKLNIRNNELDRAWHIFKDLEKTVELSNAMKKASREYYEAQIPELRNIIKECKDHLSYEKIEKEKIPRVYA